jgi:ACS family tartrate transporter-like MFS transporter
VFVRILVLWGLCAALVGGIGTPLAGHVFGWLPQIPEPSSGSDLFAGLVRFFNGLSEEPAYQFYFLRFMLGFFEGGFFPSVIVYLSYWFRQEDRAKAIAGFMSAIPLSSALGLPISGQLLKIHWLGLPGWRWIFILEGVAPMVAGIATLFLLPDLPGKAGWLPAPERDWLLGELERERQAKTGGGRLNWLNHLGGVLMLTIVYFCLNLAGYGLSMFMPAIIKSQSNLSSENASLLAAIPYGLAFLAMYVNGWHSDRTNERPWHVAVPLICLGLSIFLASQVDGMGWWPVVVMIFLVGPCMYAHLPAFWPIPTMFLGAGAAASAIGFINMIGNLGGGVGPTLVGNAAKDQAGYALALRTIAPWPLLAALVILIMGYTRRRTPAA